MKSSATFRVDHRPLRHRHRRVWAGATVPGVLVLCFYVCIALALWEKHHTKFATGRRLLDAPQGGQPAQPAQLQLELAQRARAGAGAMNSTARADAINSTAGAYGKLKGMFAILSLRAEQMLQTVFLLGCLTMFASVCILLSLCGRTDRASELQAPLQPADEYRYWM